MGSNKADVLIIGGGPAGTTFGSLMSRQGREVVLLEKDCHPRFHIGESLLPMNVPILERLGLLESVAKIGVAKVGADFTVGNGGAEYKTIYFREALGASPEYSFQVRRSEFDRILFQHCKAAGVHAFEGLRVKRVFALENGNHQVNAVDTDGNEHVWEARFVVDASGRDTVMSSANGWKKRNAQHASAAVFGHFSGATRRPGEDQGNISLYWFKNGWIWMIPLQDDVMSIGAVCVPEYLRTRRGSLDEFLLETLHSMPETSARMQNAESLMPAQAAGNYSYLSERMCGPGYLIIGDAYAFVDPVFSSGVFLAMNSAERAIGVAEAWLDGSRRSYRKACRRFERDIGKGISTFSWFIYRFTSPAMGSLMGNPRNFLQVTQAVVSMLAGDVFSNRRVRRRLLIFKWIYFASWVVNWRESFAARRARMAIVRSEAARAE